MNSKVGHITDPGYITSHFVTGYKYRVINFLISLNIFRIAFAAYRNPYIAFRTLAALIKKKKVILGDLTSLKFIRSSGRYFRAISRPGWPSLSFDHFIQNELNKIRPFRAGNNHLQTMIFSITSRCQLKCDHCYEWNNLASNETLSLIELTEILNKFQIYGISNIQLSGGEPLNRFNDLIELLRSAKPGSDFWILTSGYELTLEKARELKEAGLTGVVISLDHWKEELHNRFRKNNNSYKWVMDAARHALEVDMVVAFSLCAMKDFVTDENLERYLHMAKGSGAGFVRILEPREVGHFAGKKIELENEQIEILKRFYLKSYSDPSYKEMPLVMYPGYHQRIYGCFGAGNRYLYVDSVGDLHACPFCQDKIGNALSDDLDKAIAKMKRRGCHKFETKSED